jgi:hypothetical protein
MRFELMALFLPRICSTTELQGQQFSKLWAGLDLNQRR